MTDDFIGLATVFVMVVVVVVVVDELVLDVVIIFALHGNRGRRADRIDGDVATVFP